jgi:hypothetical protein
LTVSGSLVEWRSRIGFCPESKGSFGALPLYSSALEKIVLVEIDIAATDIGMDPIK